MGISENLAEIKSQIARAAAKSGRKPEEITLVAVTKTVGAARVNEAVSLGVTELGENRVQELLTKYDEVPGVSWHMIGRLQTNKVKFIIDKVRMIHSLDSLRLAEEISRRAAAASLTMDALVEVNIGGEAQKGGVAPAELGEFVEKAALLPAIRLRGLMTVAPVVVKSEESRHYFREMRHLFIDIRQKSRHNESNGKIRFDTLSMGMTGDFAVAVEEGATMVRIGSGLFGARL